MDRGDAAGMAGIPGLEQRQCRAVADLADNDAIGTQPHRAFEQLRHVDGIAGVQRHGILGRALDFGGVFENDHPIVRGRSDDLADDGVGERRLAGTGAPGDNDIHPSVDRA